MISPFKTIIDNDAQKFSIIDPLQYSVIQGRIIKGLLKDYSNMKFYQLLWPVTKQLSIEIKVEM